MDLPNGVLEQDGNRQSRAEGRRARSGSSDL